jgi:hypothetical protein
MCNSHAERVSSHGSGYVIDRRTKKAMDDKNYQRMHAPVWISLHDD